MTCIFRHDTDSLLYDERNGGENQDENESPEVSKEVANTMPPGKILFSAGGFPSNVWSL